jgi:hypothetical protein
VLSSPSFPLRFGGACALSQLQRHFDVKTVGLQLPLHPFHHVFRIFPTLLNPGTRILGHNMPEATGLIPDLFAWTRHLSTAQQSLLNLVHGLRLLTISIYMTAALGLLTLSLFLSGSTWPDSLLLLLHVRSDSTSIRHRRFCVEVYPDTGKHDWCSFCRVHWDYLQLHHNVCAVRLARGEQAPSISAVY